MCLVVNSTHVNRPKDSHTLIHKHTPAYTHTHSCIQVEWQTFHLFQHWEVSRDTDFQGWNLEGPRQAGMRWSACTQAHTETLLRTTHTPPSAQSLCLRWQSSGAGEFEIAERRKRVLRTQLSTFPGCTNVTNLVRLLCNSPHGCPGHLAFLPLSKEAQLELRPQGPVISRKQ